MRLIPIQEALERKFARQAAVPGLRLDAAGRCAHIGRLSPGCRACYIPDVGSFFIPVGSRCNGGCVYCPTSRGTPEPDAKMDARIRRQFKRNLEWIRSSGWPEPARVSFTGGGEPLLYLSRIGGYMSFFRSLETPGRPRPWYWISTNGRLADARKLDRLQAMGIDEIRFHLGAAGFSDRVYRRVEAAAARFPTVSVETPAWPPHRRKLFEMIRRLDDLGVRHLNLQEVEVTRANRDRIAARLPRAEVYLSHGLFLDDGGLVYELMAAAAAQGRRFSLLDCNSLVKQYQRSPGKFVAHRRVDDLFDSPPARLPGEA